MRRITIPIALAVAAAALPLAAAQGKDSGLEGEVYPSFKIEFQRGDTNVKTLTAGTYTIKIEDKSRIHNFHLQGPGVNRETKVSFVGETTWRVTFKPGTYTFRCDPHRSMMRGTFRVTR